MSPLVSKHLSCPWLSTNNNCSMPQQTEKKNRRGARVMECCTSIKLRDKIKKMKVKSDSEDAEIFSLLASSSSSKSRSYTSHNETPWYLSLDTFPYWFFPTLQSYSKVISKVFRFQNFKSQPHAVTDLMTSLQHHPSYCFQTLESSSRAIKDII